MADSASPATRVWIKNEEDEDLHILARVERVDDGQVVLEREHLPSGAPPSTSRRIVVDQAAFVPKEHITRQDTEPPKRVKERRLKNKKLHAGKKQSRSAKFGD